jgi:SSS family transporter
MQTAFTGLDAAIVIGYLAAMAAVGVFFSRRQTTIDEFFVARRSMAWLPVGLSLMAALNSGIDYLMQPSATIRYGIVLLAGTSSWIFLYPWVSRITLPFYRRMNLYTAYEFLEARFDVRVRTLAAGIFVVWRLGWMATAMYVPCLAIDAATGGRFDLRLMILGLGILVTLYTMLGGIQAVIWNDVIQFCIMFGGLGATVWIALINVPGGLSEIWLAASDAGRMSLPPAAVEGGGLLGYLRQILMQPITLPALVITMVLGRMASYTSDQVMVQRFQTTRSMTDARRAYVVNAAGDVLWMFGLSFVGLALLAYFTHHPLPPEFATDKILPYFMAQAFPAGAVGLVIAAILAASLSSIDSAINSCTAVVVVDFYNRFRGGRPEMQVRVSRVATAVLGLSGTVLAMNVSRIGTLLEIANKLINAFSGPLFGIYLLAMFSRGATSAAVLAGGLAGSFVSYYVAYHTAISFLWPSAFGLAATVATALVIAGINRVIGREQAPQGTDLTWYAVMQAGKSEVRSQKSENRGGTSDFRLQTSDLDLQ